MYVYQSDKSYMKYIENKLQLITTKRDNTVYINNVSLETGNALCLCI